MTRVVGKPNRGVLFGNQTRRTKRSIQAAVQPRLEWKIPPPPLDDRRPSSIEYMTTDNHNLQVSKEGLEAFALCLALGTLEAIRSKAWPPDAGIWTLGRPRFKSLLEKSNFPEDVMAVIEQADELSAIQELSGMDAYSKCLNQSITVLTERLKEVSGHYWHAGWTNQLHTENEHPKPDSR